MPKIVFYNCHFLKPNGDIITIHKMRSKELKELLETLIFQHYSMRYKFLTYAFYDLRQRTNRINKFVRQMLPLLEINTDLEEEN